MINLYDQDKFMQLPLVGNVLDLHGTLYAEWSNRVGNCAVGWEYGRLSSVYHIDIPQPLTPSTTPLGHQEKMYLNKHARDLFFLSFRPGWVKLPRLGKVTLSL